VRYYTFYTVGQNEQIIRAESRQFASDRAALAFAKRDLAGQRSIEVWAPEQLIGKVAAGMSLAMS
jgi:hypothetical protein